MSATTCLLLLSKGGEVEKQSQIPWCCWASHNLSPSFFCWNQFAMICFANETNNPHGPVGCFMAGSTGISHRWYNSHVRQPLRSKPKRHNSSHERRRWRCPSPPCSAGHAICKSANCFCPFKFGPAAAGHQQHCWEELLAGLEESLTEGPLPVFEI